MAAPRTRRSISSSTVHTTPPSSDSEPKTRVDSITDIKSRWGTSNKEYEMICNAFQEILKESGVLGERIQGIAAQCAVTEAIDRLLRKRRYQNALGKMDSATIQDDLRYLALQLSRNHRRRMQRDKKRQTYGAVTVPRRDATEQKYTESVDRTTANTLGSNMDESFNEPNSAQRTEMALPKGRTQSTRPARASSQGVDRLDPQIIIIRRQEEEGARMYRLEEFSSGPNHNHMIHLENLQFAQFTTVLNTDFAYTPDLDVLSYDSAVAGKILVSNEKVWKAALCDMRSQGQRHFKFELQRKERTWERETMLQGPCLG